MGKLRCVLLICVGSAQEMSGIRFGLFDAKTLVPALGTYEEFPVVQVGHCVPLFYNFSVSPPYVLYDCVTKTC
jgi:hypothetical protein